jgi:small subunit ribosomal protein S16
LVKIRLQRTGAKANPHYRIVVADSRSPRDGRFIESIGHYHPSTPGVQKYFISEDKAKDWMTKGAQPTETVRALFKKQGIIK